MFPAYIRSFTFAIKLVVAFFGENVKTRVKWSPKVLVQRYLKSYGLEKGRMGNGGAT